MAERGARVSAETADTAGPAGSPCPIRLEDVAQCNRDSGPSPGGWRAIPPEIHFALAARPAVPHAGAPHGGCRSESGCCPGHPRDGRPAGGMVRPTRWRGDVGVDFRRAHEAAPDRRPRVFPPKGARRAGDGPRPRIRERAVAVCPSLPGRHVARRYEAVAERPPAPAPLPDGWWQALRAYPRLGVLLSARGLAVLASNPPPSPHLPGVISFSPLQAPFTSVRVVTVPPPRPPGRRARHARRSRRTAQHRELRSATPLPPLPVCVVPGPHSRASLTRRP